MVRRSRREGRLPPKESSAKRSPAKRSSAERSSAERSSAKRSSAKRSSAKRSSAKRSSAKRSSAKRSSAPAVVLGALWVLAAAPGCGERERPPPAPGLDAALRDGGRLDGASVLPGRRDAGPDHPVVDGVLGASEWSGAQTASAEVPTDRDGSSLSRMLARLDDSGLYVAVEATLAEGDALIVYVDRDLGEPEGVEDLAALMDRDRPLDAALSRDLDVPPGFAPELGWGTTAMPATVLGLDESTGWRALTEDPSSFGWIDGEAAPTACTDSACEAALPLERLGGAPPRTVALFARIVTAGGTLANQTLPEDDPVAPARVGALLTVAEAGAELDGGVPDAGVAGVVVDGVIGEEEWAGATVYRGSTPGAGAFSDDRLETLRVLRADGRLAVAIEGALGEGHAFAMYVDGDLGSGVGLASPTPLDDLDGALDRALSRSLVTPAELRVDLAWGALELSRAAVEGDERMGWREVATDPTAFRPVSEALAPTACGASGCETSIPLSALGASSAGSIGLFVRLVDAASDAISNQTLPTDDPGAPELVSVFARAD